MTKRSVPEPIRRELRALRYIGKHLENVSPAGRRWLRDFLTDTLNGASPGGTRNVDPR